VPDKVDLTEIVLDILGSDYIACLHSDGLVGGFFLLPLASPHQSSSILVSFCSSQLTPLSDFRLETSQGTCAISCSFGIALND
jgi:hypothetical protein